MEQQQSLRYRLLDELRGLDLISMMLYHGMWDVVFLFGITQKWYIGRPGFLWQQSICWVFLLLSGFWVRRCSSRQCWTACCAASRLLRVWCSAQRSSG